MFGSVEVTCDPIHSSDGEVWQKGVKRTRPQVTGGNGTDLIKRKQCSHVIGVKEGMSEDKGTCVDLVMGR